MNQELPEQIMKAIVHEWRDVQQVQEAVVFDELLFEWVVWRKEQSGMLGAPLLIVPKNGKRWFVIPSSYACDERTGVTWDYEVHIDVCPHVSREAAKILAYHLNITTVDAFKALRRAPVQLGVYRLDGPLKLIRALKSYQIEVTLLRPQDRGGYRSSEVVD